VEVPILATTIANPVSDPSDPFLCSDLSDPLPSYEFALSIIPCSPAPDASVNEIEIFHRITTPYDAAAFIKLAISDRRNVIPCFLLNLLV